jgi:hypothetical protein
MALSINSHAVLRSFAEHPELFPAIQPDLAEITRKLLLKQLKAKVTDAILLKKLFEVTGGDALPIIFDSMSESEIAGLIKKIDPHSPFAKVGDDPIAARAHIDTLASGRAEPSTKPVKAPATKKPRATAKAPTSKIGEILGSKVHSGTARKARKTT